MMLTQLIVACMLSVCVVECSVVEMEVVDASRASAGEAVYKSSSHRLSAGRFSFASYYGDHMVLQGSPQQAVIWGYAPEGTEGLAVQVHLTPSNQKFTTTVTNTLTWNVKIGPIAPGGPHTVVASLKGDNITLSDVLFGDVWLCSGQSNMQFRLVEVNNSTEEIADAVNYKDIRVFIVNDKASNQTLSDFPSDGIQLQWSLPAKTDAFGNFSAVCWLYAKYLYQHLKKPFGLVESSWGGTPVEVWSSPDVIKKCGLESPAASSIERSYDADKMMHDSQMWGPDTYSVLWNAMIHPLLNMTIFGALWYQGEANSKFNENKYNCMFPSMIDDWRKKFHASGESDALFPFGFVQLAAVAPDYQNVQGFPDVRWHQTADYGYVPNHRQRNVFMAVAMDLPDFTSPWGQVHPRDKQDVAARLVRGGLAIAYKQNVSYQGPYPVKVIISQIQPYNYTQVEVEYTMALSQRWLDGFEICCAFTSPPICKPGESWWLPTTTMQAYDRANVTESYASQCSRENLVGIRYAWRTSPCPFKNCAIYGAENDLPMPPFRYFGEGFKKFAVNSRTYEVKIGT